MSKRERRRNFLKWSAASLGAASLGATPGFLRRAIATPLATQKKLLFVFLRGGIDAVQTVIPYGDQGIPGQDLKTYLQARPRLGIPQGTAAELNGFSGLNPALQSSDPLGPQVASIFHGTVDERGQNLAFLHRVGSATQNRSHFSSQQFWENGAPGNVDLEKGVFNNYLTAYPEGNAPFRGVTVNNGQMVIMKGDTLIPALTSVDAYALPQGLALGTAPTLQNPLGKGLRGAYGQTDYDASIPNENLLYRTGTAVLDTLQFFEDTVRAEPYQPETAAAAYYSAITDRVFADSIQDCARLLKQVDGLSITGCNQNGYDTHDAENTRLPLLLGDLGLALTALYHDLKPIWQDVIVVTLSEFGRTSEENGNLGTDHGEATLMTAMGGPVVGGVYNCDAVSWNHGDLFSTVNGRYVAHRTDFRAVYHEIVTGHLGDPEGHIDSILPGYTEAVAADKFGYFTPLGFLG